MVIIILIAAIFWGRALYLGFTTPIPKVGGEYIEGILGQPIYVNPLLSNTTMADSDLVSLIYSGLFKYDGNGMIENDLAESYEVSEDKKVYTVRLKNGLKWHDGQELNIDDVVYTFNIIKNPSYKSILRQNFQGVEISKVDDNTVKFELKKPYFGFLNNLVIGIVPKHFWQEIEPDRFSLAERNLRPIGSGPYMFADFQKDSNGNITTYKLSAFKDYYGGAPYISRLSFNFYPDEDIMIQDFNKKEISGMGDISPEKLSNLKLSKNMEVRELVFPRYFAIFINQTKSVALAYNEVRKALSIAVDRQGMIDSVLEGKGFPLYSPLLPQMKGYSDFSSEYAYNPEEAKKILDEAGWKMSEDDGVRKKDNDRLEFEIITTDWPQIVESANVLKSQWESIGVKVDIKILSASDFQQNYIKTREYQSVLFGQELNFSPDLYSYFHSENKRDPGLNLSLFENNEVDEAILSARQETDGEKRAEENSKIINTIKEKNPAIFLYGYYYLYPISKTIKGVEVKNINAPFSRFSNVNKWYIKTKRVGK